MKPRAYAPAWLSAWVAAGGSLGGLLGVASISWPALLRAAWLGGDAWGAALSALWRVALLGALGALLGLALAQHALRWPSPHQGPLIGPRPGGAIEALAALLLLGLAGLALHAIRAPLIAVPLVALALAALLALLSARHAKRRAAAMIKARGPARP
ncbi:hypothetical protein KKB55_18060 [Myxococcota bacterium]|nr:hypothetical protein [Myxococcota bacterium]MBU1899650.1 hypothetical protein [Myxococcota bacterium]